MVHCAAPTNDGLGYHQASVLGTGGYGLALADYCVAISRWPPPTMVMAISMGTGSSAPVPPQ